MVRMIRDAFSLLVINAIFVIPSFISLPAL
nr:MAG TPA: hypothetical protein [Caudoviricetes sp.]